jgi:uncharacterized protein YukE
MSSISKNAEKTSGDLKTMEGSIDIVSSGMGALKSKASDALNALSSAFKTSSSNVISSATSMMSGVNSTVSSGMSTTVNSFKTGASEMGSAMQTASSTTKSESSSIKSSLDQIKSAMDNTGKAVTPFVNEFSSIGDISKKVSSARGNVEREIGKIKSAFSNTKFSFNQHVAVPHFSMHGKFDAKSGTVPTVSQSWYGTAMNKAAIFDKPTIFGRSGNTYLGAGETGSEVLTGEKHLKEDIAEAVSDAGNVTTVNVTVYPSKGMDEKQLAKYTIEEMKRQIRKEIA